jgi:hypothetical protein
MRVKENNRHAYGKGNGKFGKKADRIKRMLKRKNDLRISVQKPNSLES